ncbi:hypothetical protein SO802_032615 [Lithocarpus litseifolius]|uniref:BED-type domain-containing protein n=1 Tax=Lithocarpus litseifolius TaxID=425828 RepID=A0AAW2BAV3_9ROSI
MMPKTTLSEPQGFRVQSRPAQVKRTSKGSTGVVPANDPPTVKLVLFTTPECQSRDRRELVEGDGHRWTVVHYRAVAQIEGDGAFVKGGDGSRGQGMTSSENNGSSDPSMTPIGSHQSSTIIDEDKTTPCSTPLDRPEDAQAQPNNEITEERGRLKSVVWNHFKKRKVDGKDKAECNYCTSLLVEGSKNGTKHFHDHLKMS